MWELGDLLSGAMRDLGVPGAGVGIWRAIDPAPADIADDAGRISALSP